MHSVTLVSGRPNTLIAALSSAGSPRPSTTVRKTENETRSIARRAGSGAILAERSVYFFCVTKRAAPTAALVSARPLSHNSNSPVTGCLPGCLAAGAGGDLTPARDARRATNVILQVELRLGRELPLLFFKLLFCHAMKFVAPWWSPGVVSLSSFSFAALTGTWIQGTRNVRERFLESGETGSARDCPILSRFRHLGFSIDCLLVRLHNQQILIF